MKKYKRDVQPIGGISYDFMIWGLIVHAVWIGGCIYVFGWKWMNWPVWSFMVAELIVILPYAYFLWYLSFEFRRMRRYYMFGEREILVCAGKKIVQRLGYRSITCVIICNYSAELNKRYADVGDSYQNEYIREKNGKWKTKIASSVIVSYSWDVLNFLQGRLHARQIGFFWHGDEKISEWYQQYLGMQMETQTYQLGYYTKDVLREVLEHMSVNIYITSDSYLRCKEEMDEVIQEFEAERRVYIVSGIQKVVFCQYANLDKIILTPTPIKTCNILKKNRTK